jgi:glycosyltransferase involved in cell wall biosynthesis
VVTPFHNAAATLDECVTSVRRQTLGDWEYVLVDNASTDGSDDVARRHAAQDPRIRVLRTPMFYPQVANYNFALQQISPTSRYCKLVQADDWIFPECLARMVEAAGSDARIGLVSSYYLSGDKVEGDGLPYPSHHVDGRLLCRRQLLSGMFMFGSPSCVMYRADLVRGREAFFDEGRLHEDTEACYRLLETYDLGFVHQVLTFKRVDPQSKSGRVAGFHPHLLDKLILVHRFGPVFLGKAECADRRSALESEYYRYLGAAALRRRGTEFWAYHRLGYATTGCSLSRPRIAAAAGRELLSITLHLPRLVRGVWRRLSGRRRP